MDMWQRNAILLALCSLWFVTITKGQCGNDVEWTDYMNRCWYLEKTLLNYDDARTTCQSKGGDLAIFNSAKEEIEVRDSVGVSQSSWIGLNDLNEEGTFTWTDGTTPAYTRWNRRPKQPDNWAWDGKPGSENCVEIRQTYGYRWNDKRCYYTLPSICSKPINAIQTESSGESGEGPGEAIAGPAVINEEGSGDVRL